MDKKQGRLICFDGIDGSGKTTQINLLKKYLSEKNIPFEVISFPQYGQNEFAKQIKDYLEGKLGELEEVDPYLVAKLYASDRLVVKERIKSWLDAGKLVIANRYVSSSKAHLGANLPDEQRKEFIEWIDRLEYKTNGMPKPDLNILLNVDPKIGQKNVAENHNPDIHEKDLSHEEKAAKIYLELSQAEENWKVVESMENGLPAGRQGNLKSKSEINELLVEILDNIL